MGIRDYFIRTYVNGAGASDELSAAQEALFNQKARLLGDMRLAAKASSKEPSIELYRQQCLKFAESDEGRAEIAAGRWSDKIAADLSGQDLSGVTLSEPKKIYDIKNQTPQVQGDYDSFDRDGDGKINVSALNPFYDNLKLDGASLRGAIVDPATSFNEQIHKGANLDGLTFNDMKQEDRFVFGQGQYSNIQMTNVQGGEILFGERSYVNGLSVEGKTATITLQSEARVEHMEFSDQFRIANLQMGKGATIANSNLENAVISLASNLEGGHFQNVRMNDQLKGLNFSGADLKNTFVNGKPVESVDELRGYGAMVDERTRVSLSSEVMNAYRQKQIEQQVVGIGGDLVNAQQSIGTRAAAPPVQAQTVAPNTPSVGGIAFAGEVNPANLEALAGFNPARDLVARTQPEQGQGWERGLSGNA